MPSVCDAVFTLAMMIGICYWMKSAVNAYVYRVVNEGMCPAPLVRPPFPPHDWNVLAQCYGGPIVEECDLLEQHGHALCPGPLIVECLSHCREMLPARQREYGRWRMREDVLSQMLSAGLDNASDALRSLAVYFERHMS